MDCFTSGHLYFSIITSLQVCIGEIIVFWSISFLIECYEKTVAFARIYIFSFSWSQNKLTATIFSSVFPQKADRIQAVNFD